MIDEDKIERSGFDLNNCVLEVSDMIEDLDEVYKTKYVKIFEKDGEVSIGIHSSRIKALAKRKDIPLTPFPTNVRSYSIKGRI